MHAWIHGLNWAWIALVLAVWLVALGGLGYLAAGEAIRQRPDRKHRAHPAH